MKHINFVQIIDVLNTFSKLNFSDNITSEKLFNDFIQKIQNKYGSTLKQILFNEGIKNGFTLKEWIHQENIIDKLKHDYIGNKVLNKIVIKSSKNKEKYCKELYTKYEKIIHTDESQITNSENVWAIRTQFGTGPIIFIDNVSTEEDRHNLRMWYALNYHINYFQVRECTYKYWLQHPEYRYFTSKLTD